MNKVFKTLSALTVASFTASMMACSENSTASDSDENEIIAEQELSDDEELVDVSSSSKKSKASSSSEDEESVDFEDEEIVSSSSKEKESTDSKKEKSGKFSGKVSGVSQKGPFLVGSTVTLYELDGTSFDLSGRSFVNKIKNDKGEFEVSFKDLSSNYALFIADGYYRNEVSGKKSTSPIKLNALSDLTDRNTVNVNLLTHLEFDRVKYLTMSKGVEYSKAKAQAEKEILEEFGISIKEGASAEDLSIFGTTENDGALLALSVLMQGTSAEGAFSERLSLVAQDLEEDGSIDDKQMLADIADEVALMNLSKVRKNIEGWKLSTTVPDFENFVETYWTTNYGIGDCTAEGVSKAAENTNELSKNYKKMYVCDESGWREMTADEAKYGTCSAAENGTRFENSRICDGGEWRSLTADESMGACTEEKIGETAVEENELSENFNKKHVCDKNGWRVMTEDEKKYGICSANDEGNRFEKSWICHSGNWRVMNANESMGACSEEKIGTTAVEENEFSKNYGAIHVCDGKAWHVVSELEEKLGYCTNANAHQSIPEQNFWYVCDGSMWHAVDKYGLDVYTLACEKDGDIVYSEKNKVYYVCRNGFAEPPILNDFTTSSNFTADVWNGATDSKARVDGEEYLLKSDMVGMNTYFTDVRNSNNESVFNNVSLNLITYNNNGKSSTLSDKGVKFLYAPRWDDQLGADFNLISTYVDFEDGKDISDWEGVCVVYASSVPLTVGVSEVSVENFAHIPASMDLTVANLKWEDLDDFEGGLALDIVKNTKKLSVDVYLGGAKKMLVSPAGAVYIAGIGKYNGCSVK